MRHAIPILAVILVSATMTAQQTVPVRETGIKYMRDSNEYATLARQVYRTAGEAVSRAAAAGDRSPWAVVLDVDETALDNSDYLLERATYGLAPFEPAAWSAWVERKRAAVVPGAAAFVDLVRRAGGHVAWITNRSAALAGPTRANLQSAGLWKDDDRLCAQKNPEHTKGDRRREVVTGKGECSWPGVAMRVVAFVGDQLGDFPQASEHIPQTGDDDAFGRTCFLLPNAMYGLWVTTATRAR